MLTSEQFNRTRQLARRFAGIELVERHRALLSRRSQRLEVLPYRHFDDLLNAAEAGDHDAGQRLIRLVTTRFTQFFRHPRHFEVAAQQALQAVQRRGRARLWSAGTATGEEAYSLAMALLEFFDVEDPPVAILATDIDEEALSQARAGEYGDTAMAALAQARCARFCSQVGPRRWTIASTVQRLVEFRALNLVTADWPVQGPFDVIFCRNVLMYLESSHREAALERMAALLAPDGRLMLDPAEHPGKAGHLFSLRAQGVYSPVLGQARPLFSTPTTGYP